MERQLNITVNGTNRVITTEGDRLLLDVLREDLQLTGTKYGCGEGECGACTVIVDGEAVRSCTAPVSSVAGKKVQTIEGLATGNELHAVQRAFLDLQAMQCGYCIPGQIMSAVAMLNNNPHPSRQEIVEVMRDNICRCCNYSRILAAVEQAAKG